MGIGAKQVEEEVMPEALATMEISANALLRKGLEFQTQGCDAEAIAAFSEIDRLFGNRNEGSLAAIVASSLLQKAHLLDDHAQATVLEAIIQRYGNRDEADIASPVAWAQWSKGGILEKVGRKEDALAIYRTVLHQHGHRLESSFPDLLALVRRDINRLTGNQVDEISAP